MDNQLQVFNHEQFGEVRTISEENGNIYFDANQVAQILGYAKPNDTIRVRCKGAIKHPTLKNKGGYPLTIIPKKDFVSLVANSNLLTQLEKEDLLVEFGLDDKILLQSREEVEFGEQLILFMNQLGYKVKPQYKVLDYFVDFYIPELNIAVEYDEEQHKYSYKEDNQRETEIRKKIDCKFIRVHDGLNVGTQLGQIAKYIMEVR